MAPRITTCASMAALAVLLSGCATRHSAQEMDFLASALHKVASSVDSQVRYQGAPMSVSSEELLKQAAKEDPKSMRYFDRRVLRVLRQGDDTAVLLCEAGPGRALLEDAGCTAKTDSRRWEEPGPQRCEFTLNLKAVCGK